MISFYQRFSSPLKIILSGEHSVVYGKNAIASAINLRYFSEVQEFHSSPSCFSFFFNDKLIDKFDSKTLFNVIYQVYDYGKEETSEYKSFQQIIEKNSILETCNDKSLFFMFYSLFIEFFPSKSTLNEKYFEDKSFSLKVSTKVPDLTGIGSSASYLSCISACLIKYFDFLQRNVLKESGILSQMSHSEFIEFVNKKTFGFEKIYHSNPSGIDNTIIVYGGIMVYNRINGMKFISSTAKFINSLFDVFVVNTKISKNTKTAVENVRKIYEASNEGKENIEEIGKTTDAIIEVLTMDENHLEKNIQTFADLIDKNQNLLSCFELSNQKIDLLIKISKRFGAFSKITGSGQGGCCISFWRNNYPIEKKMEFIKELESNDFEVFEIGLSIDGILDETIINK